MGRGPRRFSFTYADIGRLIGRKQRTVRDYKCAKVFTDLGQTIQWVSEKVWALRAAPLPDEKVAWFAAVVLDKSLDPSVVRARLKDWRLRWPKLDAYPCGALLCDGVVFGGTGLCSKHGKPPISLGASGELRLRVGDDYIALGDLFYGDEASYKDGNPWNAHPSNLCDYEP